MKLLPYTPLRSALLGLTLLAGLATASLLVFSVAHAGSECPPELGESCAPSPEYDICGESYLTCGGGGGGGTETGGGGGESGPSLSFGASPSLIDPGEYSTLTWSSYLTTSCSSPDFDTGGEVAGTTQVSPASDTTYHISCQTESSGTLDRTATVYVGPFPNLTAGAVIDPIVSFIGSPKSVSAIITNAGAGSTDTSFNYTFRIANGYGYYSQLGPSSGYYTSMSQQNATHSAMAGGSQSTVSVQPYPSYVYGNPPYYAVIDQGTPPDVQLCADDDGAVQSGYDGKYSVAQGAHGGTILETSETDNCGPWTQLKPSTCTVSDTNPDPGEQVTFTITGTHSSFGPITYGPWGSSTSLSQTTWPAIASCPATGSWNTAGSPVCTTSFSQSQVGQTIYVRAYMRAGTSPSREGYDYCPPITVGAAPAACEDGQDNDGDGLADYGSDPGCASPSDTSEEDACSNPQGELSASPTRVRQDTATPVTFTYEATGATSCAIVGPGVNQSLAPAACTLPTGTSSQTISISTQGIYELVCDSETLDSVIINVVPVFDEF